MPKSKKRPAQRGTKTGLSKRQVRPEFGDGFQQDRLKPFKDLKGGARGKPPRFPGRTGGR